MHEMGIALQIIDIVKASIPNDMKDQPVKSVNLSIGKFSAVIPDSLRFCFQIAVKDTVIENEELHITEQPVVIQCKACQKNQVLTEPIFICNFCKSSDVTMISGNELDIVSIEM